MISAATASTPDAAGLEARVRTLMPIDRLKWCCILLNDFLEPGRGRRPRRGGADLRARRPGLRGGNTGRRGAPRAGPRVRDQRDEGTRGARLGSAGLVRRG